MSNILHRTFYVNTQSDDMDTLVAMAYHTSLVTLNKYYKVYNPDKIIFVFDRDNWRLAYTQSEECRSKRLYKAHRRQNMTPKQKEHYKLFKQFIVDFEELMRKHSSIVCLAADQLEADDLIAGFCQMYHEESEIFIISADKDLLQLLQYPNVRLIDPATSKDRTLDEYDNDAQLFLYMKAIRGDQGDNIQSALPRVHKKKIIEAYNEPYKHVNMMEQTWTDHEGREHTVKDLFEENKRLTDLSAQPEHIKEIMVTTINHEMSNCGKYSHFHFIRFLGKYNLKNVSRNLETFIPLLSK
jgi:5'-3' exonuclease